MSDSTTMARWHYGDTCAGTELAARAHLLTAQARARQALQLYADAIHTRTLAREAHPLYAEESSCEERTQRIRRRIADDLREEEAAVAMLAQLVTLETGRMIGVFVDFITTATDDPKSAIHPIWLRPGRSGLIEHCLAWVPGQPFRLPDPT